MNFQLQKLDKTRLVATIKLIKIVIAVIINILGQNSLKVYIIKVIEFIILLEVFIVKPTFSIALRIIIL